MDYDRWYNYIDWHGEDLAMFLECWRLRRSNWILSIALQLPTPLSSFFPKNASKATTSLAINMWEQTYVDVFSQSSEVLCLPHDRCIFHHLTDSWEAYKHVPVFRSNISVNFIHVPADLEAVLAPLGWQLLACMSPMPGDSVFASLLEYVGVIHPIFAHTFCAGESPKSPEYEWMNKYIYK